MRYPRNRAGEPAEPRRERTAYQSPAPDEPLDDVQRAIVQMFVRTIVQEIRDEEAASSTALKVATS